MTSSYLTKIWVQTTKKIIKNTTINYYTIKPWVKWEKGEPSKKLKIIHWLCKAGHTKCGQARYTRTTKTIPADNNATCTFTYTISTTHVQYLQPTTDLKLNTTSLRKNKNWRTNRRKWITSLKVKLLNLKTNLSSTCKNTSQHIHKLIQAKHACFMS